MRSITVGGVADKDGQLSVGDQILEVQDKNLIDVHYEKVRDSMTHLIFACSLFLDLAPVHPSVRPSVHHALSYRVCVINSSHNFYRIFLKPCIPVVDILKMCMWVFGGARINFDRIAAFRT